MFDAMLALSVIISIFGVVNTLALSVLERTREIGLLRAVGSSRRQVRRARSESSPPSDPRGARADWMSSTRSHSSSRNGCR